MTEQFDTCNAHAILSPEVLIEIQVNAITFGEMAEINLGGVVRDYGTLEYICERCNSENDLIKCASLALFYVSNFHPFYEANKRTALMTADAILKRRYTLEMDPTQIDDKLRKIASPEGTWAEAYEWIIRNIKAVQ